MKNKINKYFFKQFLRYFAVTLFSVISVAWIVQAVNFLDLVVEDGHAFSVYFSFSLLTIPKIITRLIPFCFLISIILTVVKFEKDNELIVLWTSGLNKIRIVNLILLISFVTMLLHVFMASTITPLTLNISRSILKNSTLDFFPTLIKEKKFNDSIEDVTFFVEEKAPDGSFKNIFIRDNNKIFDTGGLKSSTIYAKSGYIQQDKNSRYIILFDGTIQKEKPNGKINSLKFKKTSLDIMGLAGKTITEPKIQETASSRLLTCTTGNDFFSSLTFINLDSFYYTKDNKKNIIGESHNCSKGNKNILIELNRRFGMPLYIPILALVVSFLLSSRKENRMAEFRKYIYFFIGVFVIVTSEISIRYSTTDYYILLYYMFPFLIMSIIYLILLKTFKYENLVE